MTGYDAVAAAVGGMGLLGGVAAIATCLWLRHIILTRDEQAETKRIRAHQVVGLDGREYLDDDRDVSEDYVRRRRAMIVGLPVAAILAFISRAWRAGGHANTTHRAMRRAPSSARIGGAAVAIGAGMAATIAIVLAQPPPGARRRMQPTPTPTVCCRQLPRHMPRRAPGDGFVSPSIPADPAQRAEAPQPATPVPPSPTAPSSRRPTPPSTTPGTPPSLPPTTTPSPPSCALAAALLGIDVCIKV